MKQTPHPASSGQPASTVGPTRPLLIIALFGLAVRVGYAQIAATVDPFLVADPLHGDAASYDGLARSLLVGSGFSLHPPEPDYFWPPLYPGLMWVVYSVGGHDLELGRLVQGLLGAVVPPAVYVLGRSTAGNRVAMLSGLCAAVYPHLLYFGAWLIADPLYMALLAAALLVTTQLARRPLIRWGATLGILLGLAILAKPTGTMMLFWLGLWFLVALKGPLRRRLVLGAVTAVALAVIMLPWMSRNFADTGYVFVSTNGGYTFYGANNPDWFGGHREGFPPPIPGLSEPEQEHEYYRLAVNWIVGDPAGFAALVRKKYERLLSPLSVGSWEEEYPLPFSGAVRATYLLFLALAAAGIGLSARRWRECAVLYLPVLAVLTSTGLFYGDARFTLPMVPSLLIFASSAVVALFDTWARLWSRARARDIAPSALPGRAEGS